MIEVLHILKHIGHLFQDLIILNYDKNDDNEVMEK